MEQLLQYVWKHKMFPLGELKTTDDRVVEVIDPGLHNHNKLEGDRLGKSL